jgi:hypothetical protein
MAHGREKVNFFSKVWVYWVSNDATVEQPMKDAVRLALHFDPAGLKADYMGIGAGDWTAHFNAKYFEGDWSGVALRAPEKAANPILPDANREACDTDLVAQYPHLHAVIEAFQCPLKSVRLLKLGAGSVIREHRDYDLGYEIGEVRIHVPVITNPGVEFFLNSRRMVMNEGECWYLDLSLPHRVHNRGATDRIHLVMDCVLNDWLRAMIEHGTPEAGTESGFEPFRRLVLGDAALQQELMQTADRGKFIALTLELGQARGFDFTEEDVTAALRSAHAGLQERRAG